MNARTDFPVLPLKLEIDHSYYISGRGIFKYTGEVEKIPENLIYLVSRQYRVNSGVIHKFQPDPVYAKGSDAAYIFDKEINNAEKVHSIPTPSALQKILNVLLQKSESTSASPADIKKSFDWKIKTASPLQMAILIQHAKSINQFHVVSPALDPMACILAYHLDALPGEARAYLELVVQTKKWPDKLPVVPVDRTCMNAVVQRRTSEREFSDEFINAVQIPKQVFPKSSGRPPSVLETLTPVSNVPDTETEPHNVPTEIPVTTIPPETPSTSPGPDPERPPLAIQTILVPISQLPHANVVRRMHEGEKKKFISSKDISKEVIFTERSKIYRPLIESIDDPLQIKLIHAASGLLTQGDVLDLSRLFLTIEKFNIYSVVQSKNKDLNTEEQRWDPTSVRAHYERLLSQLMTRLSRKDQLTSDDHPRAMALYNKIGEEYFPPKELKFLPQQGTGLKIAGMQDEQENQRKITGLILPTPDTAVPLPALNAPVKSPELQETHPPLTIEIHTLGSVVTKTDPIARELNILQTPGLQETFKLAAKYANAYRLSVLFQGRTGTGKTGFAKYLHAVSPRKDKPFRIVNLTQSPSTIALLEDMLFGHEKGSYTGATQTRRGLLEECDGGTIFLDEIGSIDPSTQQKLQHAVETGEYSRLGSNEVHTANIRFLFASSKNLDELVAAKQFTEDFYFRLKGATIHIPALCDRPQDILPLAEHFLHYASQEDRLPQKTLSDPAKKLLLAYNWPGNVRELQTTIRVATAFADSDIIQPANLNLG